MPRLPRLAGQPCRRPVLEGPDEPMWLPDDFIADPVLLHWRPQEETRQSYRCQRAAFASGLSLLALGACAVLLHRQSRGRGEAAPTLQLQAGRDNCEDYFNARDRDCSQTNYWECNHNDGSWGYACCCFHGFGDFAAANSSNRTVGMISWAAHPDKCVDLGTPYEQMGAPFSAGPVYVGSCTWGNNNKHFSFPASGKGMIHWATHPKYCLAVRGGADFVGNQLHLQYCWEMPKRWGEFNVSIAGDRGGLIRWMANPNKCLRVRGTWDGAEVLLAECQEEDELQRFGVLPLREAPRRTDPPRLFCLSLMLPFGNEVGLIRTQFEHETGIFACYDSAVYSNESMFFKYGNRTLLTDVVNGSLEVQFGGRWNTALNTDVFIRFWSKVVTDARTWRNDWTVKLDPDTVFFAWRLQDVLRSLRKRGETGRPAFLNNCFLGNHGPIEVLERGALDVYKRRWKECIAGEPYTHKQEDFFTRRCWQFLGIEKINVYNLLYESAYACAEISSTRDGRHPCFSKQVAFHPFKTPEGYRQCYTRGNSMKWSTPLVASSEGPTFENGHHG